VALIRAERPQVLLTYGEDHSAYPHPDHIRTHEISAAAYDAAADAARYPWAGDPWQVAKLYYMVFSRRRVQALHDWLVANGKESPFADWLKERDWPDDDFLRTRIDVRDHIETARAALRAHRTQVPPDSFFFAVPTEVVRAQFPWEEYALARSTVPGTVPENGFETDLFAGLR
jgi:mycothiol S-conjugate amidase